MAAAGNILFDGGFGLCHIGIQHQILALAIDDDIRRKGRCNGARSLQDAIYQGIFGYLQGLEATSAAGEDLPDGGNEFRHAAVHLGRAFRQGLYAAFQIAHDTAVDAVYLLRGIGPHENTVVLQENHLRLPALFGLPGLQAVIYLLEKGITGVCIFNVQGVREQLVADIGGVHGTHETVHQRGMQVHHIGKFHAVVQAGFHRRPTVLSKAGRCQVFLHLSLALRGIGAIGLLPHGSQFSAVQHGKAVLVNGGQGVAAGLYPKMLRILEGRISAARNHIAGIGPVLTGNGNQVL